MPGQGQSVKVPCSGIPALPESTAFSGSLVGPKWTRKKNKEKQNIISSSSDEEETLVSRKETIALVGDEVSASHSTPSSSKQTKETVIGSDQTKKIIKKKKRRSTGVVLKSHYQKALYILGKIAKNESEGRTHEKDAEDKIKYQAVVDEYLKHPPMEKSQSKASKRNRSQDEISQEARKSKAAKLSPTASTSASAAAATKTSTTSKILPGKKYCEVARDHLQVALVDEKATGGRIDIETWNRIEAKLSEMVMDHVLSEKGTAIPSFDSSEVLRGCRVIRCENEFSRDFLTECVAAISEAWEGLRLKLIPAKEIPRRPRARIWLPKMKLESSKLLKCLQMQNPEVPMNDWAVIKAEEPQKNSTSYLLLLNEECLGALEKADYKLRFGIRHAKLKIFRPSGQEGEAEEAMIEDMKTLDIAENVEEDKPTNSAD